LVALVIALLSSLLPAQTPREGRIDVQWILRYEQAYGIDGLYVDEPPPRVEDGDAMIRLDLVELTVGARRFKRLYPTENPTPSLLFLRNMIERKIQPPTGIEYTWVDESSRFVAVPPGKGRGDIVSGALLQLEAAEEYRRVVANGSAALNRNWQVLLDDPQTPELIRREIETRRYAARQTQTEAIHHARRTQALLQELNDCMELALAAGMLRSGEEITMQDVGRTGLIDLLERLPLDGEYVVTRAGEPPKARIRGREIPLAPSAIVDALRYQAQQALEAQPDYPPAMAVLARYLEPEKSLELITRAIEKWPDVPALRIQRLATNAKMGRFDALTEDLDMIVERFPTAPLLLEIDAATYDAKREGANELRAALIAPLAEIRPQVLPIQLLAFVALTDVGDKERAEVVRQRVLDRHPGFEPLLVVEEKD